MAGFKRRHETFLSSLELTTEAAANKRTGSKRPTTGEDGRR
eukprot:gene15406-6646_t